MAFVLNYVREFPGTDYRRVKAAAQAAGVGVPAPVLYGNAVRVLKLETAREAQPAEVPVASHAKRRRRGAARGLGDLAGLVEQMEAVVDERDRLRQAVDAIGVVVKQLRA